MTQKSDRGAVLQFEFDRKRVAAMSKTAWHHENVGAKASSHDIIRAALQDVLDNGGTLVVVATPEKLTVIQRPDAETFDD
jgi:hypothetical protein